MYSMRWFKYTTDEGLVYGVKRDESNTELVNTTGDSSATIAAGTNALPKGYRARFISIFSPDGLQKKDCTILSAAQYAAIAIGASYNVGGADYSGIEGSAQGWIVRTKTPELLRRQPFNGDTGNVDGD